MNKLKRYRIEIERRLEHCKSIINQLDDHISLEEFRQYNSYRVIYIEILDDLDILIKEDENNG